MEFLKAFKKGKKYVFKRDVCIEHMKEEGIDWTSNLKWINRIDGKEVEHFLTDDKGAIAGFTVSAWWCEEIKEAVKEEVKPPAKPKSRKKKVSK